MRFVVEVITIGGGLPDLLGASCSSSLHVHVSTPGRCKESAAFGGSLAAVDVRTGLVNFLALCEVLLEVCLLCVFPLWKSSSWDIDFIEVLFTVPLYPACALTLKMAFSSFSVAMYMP
jgi:hypothetical protein